MHIQRPGEAQIDDGDDAVDLDMPPADHLFLSFADTELVVLRRIAKEGPGSLPSLGLVDLKQLRHPMSVDLFVEKTAVHARTITVRALGGAGYWSYGFDRLLAVARASNIALAVIPGDDKPDPALTAFNTVTPEVSERLWRYCAEGGPGNLENAILFVDHLTGVRAMPPPPAPIPRFGLYWPGLASPSRADIAARQDGTDGRAALVFYRALVQAETCLAVDALIAALNARRIAVMPFFVSSLKSADDDAFARSLLAAWTPNVVLNMTAFAISKAGGSHRGTALDSTGAVVLQVVNSGQTQESWLSSKRGLLPRDLAMNVVLPEVDGRVHGPAIAFKTPARDGEAPQPLPLPDRVDFAADLAKNWARLARTPAGRRRVSLVLHNYPNRDGRIGNGVGLDTPASAIEIATALRRAGYDVTGAPDTVSDLMNVLLAGPTNRLKSERQSPVRLDLADYERAFNNLPVAIQRDVIARWGDAQDDPFFAGAAFRLPAVRYGNLAVMIQPARGYNIDPKSTYHDPDLVPPHGYFAAYFWLRHQFGAHAVIHLGKHGTLEWLPGKGTALSAECYPQAISGPLPQLYPFIVNDPGEGAQAKRRTSAVVVDHMTPPMARAESHGVSLRLEALLDEFAEAEAMDPPRARALEASIVDLVRANGFDKDLGIDAAGEPDLLLALDNHLCDLKELQIRDGLHVFGRSPRGAARTAHLAALARVPRFGDAVSAMSLQRAIAQDLDLGDFDPLDCEMGAPYRGSRPGALSAMADTRWRTNGDTIERIELLAERLVDGRTKPDGLDATRKVLDWLDGSVSADLDACGKAEIGGLLAGLDGHFVPPGPSGAPTRGRPDVLPTGRNFYAVDIRAVPSRMAWEIGRKSAEYLVARYFQDEGEWPRCLAVSAWGTSNMRTGGDDIAQALALIGVAPVWEEVSGRVTGFQVQPLSDLGRPRVDVVLRISGFFRDAFPHLIQLFDSAVAAVADLDEPDDANPLAASFRETRRRLLAQGTAEVDAVRFARHRIFGAMPGAYGAGLQTLIDEGLWESSADFAEAFLTWGGYAYGSGVDGAPARGLLEERLMSADAIVHNQDNREHDLLDSDDYYQFEGGLAATVEHLSGGAPRVYHNDHSRPEKPVIRALSEEIGRVVRGRAANPKWISGVMRHGYKGAFEIAATVDYLYAFAATTRAVGDHHFDQLYNAYIADPAVLDFIANENEPALREIAGRFADAIERGLWSPRQNSAYSRLRALAGKGKDQLIDREPDVREPDIRENV